MSDQDIIQTKQTIWTYTDFRERMTIAKSFGISSRQTIHNLFHPDAEKRTKNFALLRALIEKAEENKALIERAKNIEAA